MLKQLLLVLVLLASLAARAHAAGLQLTIEDGKVTLDAEDVTIRQILTEWARVGQTRIVNIERLTGAPVTLKLEAVPEKQALDIILRALPGYVAAPRATFVANASIYETILVMATTTAVAAVRPPQPSGPAAGLPGAPFGTPGLPFTAGSIIQLRQAAGAPPRDGQDLEPDPADDPALAAAAAAGLIPAPASAMPVVGPLGPISLPGQAPQPTPSSPAPTNPWNAPIGTAQPSLPEPAPAAPPPVRTRAPQPADR